MKIKTDRHTKYKFIIVGLGATGSQLLPFLTQLLNNFKDHQVVLIDGDIVELKNLDNQKFLESDINRFKVEVLAERYQAVYPNLDISFSTDYIKNNDDLKIFLNHHYSYNRDYIPVLISCVDNNASRKIFDISFHDDNINKLIYIDSGNGTIDRNGQIVVGYKDYKTTEKATYGNNYRSTNITEIKLKSVCDIFPAIREDDDKIENHTGCSRVSDVNPQNIGTNIYAAANIFMILNNLIAFNELPTHVIYFDAVKGESIAREIIS